jgi:hypothetical protein
MSSKSNFWFHCLAIKRLYALRTYVFISEIYSYTFTIQGWILKQSFLHVALTLYTVASLVTLVFILQQFNMIGDHLTQRLIAIVVFDIYARIIQYHKRRQLNKACQFDESSRVIKKKLWLNLASFVHAPKSNLHCMSRSKTTIITMNLSARRSPVHVKLL